VSDIPLTVDGALRRLMAELAQDGADIPARDVRLLLAHAMEIDPGRLTLMARDPLDEGIYDAARSLCIRRSAGTPVSHLRGYRDFYGRRFTVNDKVLDPRPETETLVAEALAAPFATVLDLGTGSGCILVSLLAERPDARGIGTDLSPEAIGVAQGNAERHGVLPRAGFIESDWFDRVEGCFDLIVSNPPYIALDEMAGLSRDVLTEPRMALTDEGDGLSAYRQITRDAPAHLAPGGRLMVEIGPAQGQDVVGFFRSAGLVNVCIAKDFDGRDRVVSGQKPR